MAQQRGSERYLGGAAIRPSDQISLPIRIPQQQKPSRTRRFGPRYDRNNWKKISLWSIALVLSLILFISIFSYYFLSKDNELNRFSVQDDELKDDSSDFLSNVTRTTTRTVVAGTDKVLNFGHGSGTHGKDSRYWDRDDRRRDREYNNEVANEEQDGGKQVGNERKKVVGKPALDTRGVGLYNEAGRNELKLYEAEYEASLKNVGQLLQDNGYKWKVVDDGDIGLQNEFGDLDDEYDDGIDFHDARMTEYDETRNENDNDVGKGQENSVDVGDLSVKVSRGTREMDMDVDPEDSGEVVLNTSEEEHSRSAKVDSTRGSVHKGRSTKRARLDSRRGAPKRHKFSGSSCEMKFLNSTAQLVEPLESRKFSRFSLHYTDVEERPTEQEGWEPRFAGHQSLQEREDSFFARDQKINCGFIKGPKGSASTGFDLAEDDKQFMSSCHIAVSSCIFGNSDNLRTPTSKTVTRLSKKNVCFVMFMDENTLQTLSSEGQKPDRAGFIGLWKTVVVNNLPFADMRRVGKIPKFLTHRLFPSARYSIWLDSKLRLQSDPLLILEYFLWRKGYEYAISNHYDRHCVWEEVAQNKRLNKFNHMVIDEQFQFYQADGLKRFNASDPNKLLPSNVPEGSFIVRAHTPMSNLFSCLWFNEVDRFTPRDQLSFAYVYHKLSRVNVGKPFRLNMFKDCERRAMAKLFHHKPEERRNIPLQALG